MTTTTFHSHSRAIAAWAALRPNAPAALMLDAPAITWVDFDRLVHHVAATLHAAGIGPADPVALLMPPSRDALMLTLAVAAAAPAAPLDHRAPVAELAATADLLNPRLTLVDPALRERAEALGCPVIEVAPGPVLLAEAPAALAAPPRPSPNDVAFILVVAGRDGGPRLVPRTHGQIVGTALPLAGSVGLSSGDRWLDLGFTLRDPSLTGAMAAIYSGGAIVSPHSVEPAAALAAVTSLRPTWATGSPARYGHLLEAMIDERADDGFRLLIVDGPLVEPALAATLESRLGAPVVVDYSLPEAPHIALATAASADEQGLAFHALIPGTLAIVTADDPNAPPDQPGEIVTAGPHCFPGYLGGANTDDALLPGGGLRTGDRGYIDELGALHILGRTSPLIERGGAAIDPLEVETVLRAHPDVEAAGVYGVPDDALGMDLRAAVVIRPGAAPSSRELRRWMIDRLAVSKVPRAIVMLDALPLAADGSVDRSALSAAVDAQTAAAATITPAAPDLAAIAAPDEASVAHAADIAEATGIDNKPATPDEVRFEAPPTGEQAGIAGEDGSIQQAEDASPSLPEPAASGTVVLGPVMVIEAATLAGDGATDAEHRQILLALAVEPAQSIRHLILRCRCDDPSSDRRLFQLIAGDARETFILRPAGSFGLEFIVDLPPGQLATISLAPITGDGKEPRGKRKKGKSGKKAGSPAAHGNDLATLDPHPGLVVESIEFRP